MAVSLVTSATVTSVLNNPDVSFPSASLQTDDLVVVALVCTGDGNNTFALDVSSDSSHLLPLTRYTPDPVNPFFTGFAANQHFMFFGYWWVTSTGSQVIAYVRNGSGTAAAGYTVAVANVFRGLNSSLGTAGGKVQMSDTAAQFTPPTFTFTPANRELLVITAGAQFGDAATGWTPSSPVSTLNKIYNAQGGWYNSNVLQQAGKAVALGYDIDTSAGAAGATSARHITGIATPGSGNPTMFPWAFSAYAFGAPLGGWSEGSIKIGG